jgi:hypothetical protein
MLIDHGHALDDLAVDDQFPRHAKRPGQNCAGENLACGEADKHHNGVEHIDSKAPFLEQDSVGASFNTTQELAQAIDEFGDAWHEKAHPFVWRKREVRGSQIKNTISNLTE